MLDGALPFIVRLGSARHSTAFARHGRLPACSSALARCGWLRGFWRRSGHQVGRCRVRVRAAGLAVRAFSLSLVAGLLLASGGGVLNGCLISSVRLNPFIVTLCTMSVFRGTALMLTDGRPVFDFSESFMALGGTLPGGLSVPALLALSVAGMGVFLMRFTKFGAYACFMGCNEEALSRSGVSVHRWKLAFYALSGLCSGLAGLVLCARLNTAEPLAAVGIEMEVIDAVILSGTDIRGGRGSAAGSLLACLFLALLRNGFVVLNVSARYQQLLMGLIVLAH